jgi:ABC-type glycerol-3-phosphate transport system substrate-binding protein
MNKRFGSVLSFAALIVGGLSAAGQKAAEPAASAAAPTEISMQISWGGGSGRGKAIREIS